MTAVDGNSSVYQVYPASLITGEGRVEILRSWGPGFEQEGAREEGDGGGQLSLFEEIVNPLRRQI